MKSKVLDSQQWWSSIIIINLCSCNGLLASEGPDRSVYASEFELLNKLWWWLYIINVCHIWWTSVILMYDRRHILWMSIINEYDGCPINMNMIGVHHLWLWWMSTIYEYNECLSFMKMTKVHRSWIWWMSIIYEWDEWPSYMTYACIEFWMPVICVWWMSIIFDVLQS